MAFHFAVNGSKTRNMFNCRTKKDRERKEVCAECEWNGMCWNASQLRFIKMAPHFTEDAKHLLNKPIKF